MHSARGRIVDKVFAVWAVFIPLACAQKTDAPPDPPVQVLAQVSPIDPQVWKRFKAGPGLFMKVHNVSGRGILGFAFETVFTNPETGRTIDVHEHSAFRPASRGISLPPDGTKPNPKPYQLPVTASGAPANYTFRVDLVIFEDGSTWGPAKLDVSQAILVRLKSEK